MTLYLDCAQVYPSLVQLPEINSCTNLYTLSYQCVHQYHYLKTCSVTSKYSMIGILSSLCHFKCCQNIVGIFKLILYMIHVNESPPNLKFKKSKWIVCLISLNFCINRYFDFFKMLRILIFYKANNINGNSLFTFFTFLPSSVSPAWLKRRGNGVVL